MNTRELLQLGFKDLRDKKLRTMLTILSIMIGIASIISLVSQTTGIQASVVNSLQSLGPTSIFVSPRLVQGFSDADVARMLSIPGVSSVKPLITSRASITLSGQTTSFNIIGISSAGFTSILGQPKLMDGFFYPDTSAPLVVIGHKLVFPISGDSQVLFVGQSLPVQLGTGSTSRSVTLSVVGLLNTYGSTTFVSVDDSVFMPLEAVERLLNRRTYTMLLVQATDVDQVSNISNFLTQIYGNSATITATEQVTQTVSNIIGMFGILLGSIAAISLTVASVGILNIMFVSVIERTHVIGILKSIGFRNRDILRLFLSEAMIMGILGGVAGIAAGCGMSYVIPNLLSRLFSQTNNGTFRPGGFGGVATISTLSYDPVISPEIVVASFLIAIGVSIFAGLYPAHRASTMDPIKALRYE